MGSGCVAQSINSQRCSEMKKIYVFPLLLVVYCLLLFLCRERVSCDAICSFFTCNCSGEGEESWFHIDSIENQRFDYVVGEDFDSRRFGFLTNDQKIENGDQVTFPVEILSFRLCGRRIFPRSFFSFGPMKSRNGKAIMGKKGKGTTLVGMK